MKIIRYALLIGVFQTEILCSDKTVGAAEPDPQTAAYGIIQRLAPDNAGRFILETLPADDGRDVFESDSGPDGKIVIRGSNGLAIASGWNWYLKYYCHCHVSLWGNNLNLPDPLPALPEKIRRVSPFQYRYYLNFCAFSYSLPWFDWPQWERLIDWMALHGINMPLSVTGQEAIWAKVYRDLGLTDEQLGEFFAGPGYLPFGWMGCLDGWGGPLPKDWIDRRLDLQKKIVTRQRELGMKPVLQGFTGHVPAAIKDVFPDAKLEKLSWGGFNTMFLHPNDPLFVRIGSMFIEEQTRQFGTDHLYASDTFIEMPPKDNDPEFLAAMSRGVYDAMRTADPQAVWVMQGWMFFYNPGFWQPPQAKALLGGAPDDRMILLDLMCESHSVWDKTDAFYGKCWIWNIVQDFGNQVSMHGDLSQIADNLRRALTDPGRKQLVGIGMVNEGLGHNPIVNEFFSEMAWRSDVIEPGEWVSDYVRSRYGDYPKDIEQAWRLLLETVYSTGHRSACGICARPDSRNWNGSAFAPIDAPPYDNTQLATAWRKLIDGADQLGHVDGYRYDMANLGRQVLNNLANELLKDAAAAWLKKDRQALSQTAARLLELIRDMDDLCATREEFLLGRWLGDAKGWATNEQERKLYEWNARNIITLWNLPGGGLNEYACRQWSGMLTGFYLPRWQRFFQLLDETLAQGKPFDRKTYRTWEDELIDWEVQWTHQNETYPDTPTGAAVDISRRLWKKYGSVVEKESNIEADIRLENDTLSLKIDPKTSMLSGLENRLTGETYSIRNDQFRIKTAEWTVGLYDMKLACITVTPGEVQAQYEHPWLEVTVTYSLGPDHHFAQKKMALTFAQDCGLKQVVLGEPTFSADGLKLACYRYPNFDMVAAMVKARHGWEFKRPPDSEPNRTFFGRTPKGGFFTGVEMPYDHSELIGNGVTLSYTPSLKVKAGRQLDSETAYLGVYRRSGQDVLDDNSWQAIESLWTTDQHDGGFDGAAAAGAEDNLSLADKTITIPKPEVSPLRSESDAMSLMVSLLYGPPRHGIKALGNGWFSQMQFDGWDTEEELQADLESMAFFQQCGLDIAAILGPPWGETDKINNLREGDHYKFGPAIRRILDRADQLDLDVHLGSTFTNSHPWTKLGLPYRLDRPQWLRGIEGEPTNRDINNYSRQFGNCMGCNAFVDWLEQLLTETLATHRFKCWIFDGDFWGTGGYFHTVVPVTCTADYHDHLPGDSNYACQKALQRLIAKVRQLQPDTYIFACRPPVDLGVWALRNVDTCYSWLESGGNEDNIIAGNEIRTLARLRKRYQFLPCRLDQALLFPANADPTLQTVAPWPSDNLDYVMLSALSISPNFNMYLPTKTGIPENDKQTIKKWLDWGRDNVRYILVRRDLPDWPEKGKVDGSAHIIDDRGLIFLFNPGSDAMEGEFTLNDQSIGLTTSGTYSITQEYPPAVSRQMGQYGDAIRRLVPAQSAVVLRILPVQ